MSCVEGTGIGRAEQAGRETSDEKLENCLKELVEHVRSSAQLRRFEKIAAVLRKDPEKKERIDCFRRQTYLTQNSQDPMEHMDEIRELASLRRKIREDMQAAEYLDAELDLCRLLQHICFSVLEIADVEIESFEHEID